MSKFNFSRIQRRDRKPQRIELKDPGAPGETMVVWLKALDDVDEEVAESRAAELVARFVTGGFRHENGHWLDKPVPFPPIGDQAVRLSKSFLRIAARIETMQAPPSADERHSFDELVYCAVLTPAAWRELQSRSARIQREYDAQGKATEGSGDPSETPPAS